MKRSRMKCHGGQDSSPWNLSFHADAKGMSHGTEAIVDVFLGEGGSDLWEVATLTARQGDHGKSGNRNNLPPISECDQHLRSNTQMKP